MSDIDRPILSAAKRIGFALLGFVICGLVGCGGKESIGEMSSDVTSQQLERCQEKMNLLIPIGAQALGIWTQPEPNESIKLKLEMSKTDYDALVRSSAFDGKSLMGAASTSFGANVDWWDPDNQSELRSGFMPLGQGKGQLSMGVVEQSSSRVLVYLVWIADI